MSIKIEIIDNVGDFVNLHDDWDRIYVADEYANIFLSWSWLKAKFEIDHAGLCILAAKNEEKDDYVAFWPLKLNKMTKFKIITVNTTLLSAGAPFADYSGLICLPKYENTALPAFVDHLKTKLKWQTLKVNDSLDPRLGPLFHSIGSDAGVETSETQCPCIALADDWETYLKESISRSTRKKLRKKMKDVFEGNDFRVERLTGENLERNVAAALALWSSRWDIKSEQYVRDVKELLFAAHKENLLWLNAIWKDAEPMAMQVGFADKRKQAMYSYFSAYSDKFSDYSPGAVVKGWSIKQGIEAGYKTYDFLRGAESYKYSFGAKDRIATTYRIENHAGDRLN